MHANDRLATCDLQNGGRLRSRFKKKKQKKKRETRQRACLCLDFRQCCPEPLSALLSLLYNAKPVRLSTKSGKGLKKSFVRNLAWEAAAATRMVADPTSGSERAPLRPSNPLHAKPCARSAPHRLQVSRGLHALYVSQLGVC